MKKLFLFLFLIPVICRAQDSPLIRFNTTDGLGHSIVYRIYEDKKGFLWLSTDNGLTRYDGKEFKNFGANDGLRSTFIFGVTENDSALIVSTFGGGLHTMKGAVIDTLNKLAPSIDFPINILQDDTLLWVVDRGLNLYQVTKDTVRNFSYLISHPNKKASDIIKTSKGTLLLSYGIYLYNKNEKVFKRIPLKGEALTNNEYVKSGIELPGGNLLLYGASQIGLVLVDMQRLQTKIIKPGKFILSQKNMLLRHDSTVLVAEDNGTLWHFSKDLKSSKKILEGVVINDLYEDKAHRLWLATHGEGLWCLPNIDATVFTLKGFLSPSISKTDYTENVLVNSLNKPVQALDNTLTEKQAQSLPAVIRQSGITYLQDTDSQEKEVLVGNLYGVYRLRKNEIDSLIFGRSQTSGWKDKQGNYWFGMRTGLAQVNPDFKEFNFVKPFDNKIIRSVSENHLSQLTVGTNDGLFIAKDTGWIRLGKLQGLHDEYVNMILADTLRKATWVATNDGLLSYNGKTLYTVYKGLRCNTLLFDKRQHLWASTSKGLLWYDGRQLSIFSESHGIPQDLIDLSYDKQKDIFYLLSNNSVTRLSAASILTMADTIPPVITITEHLVNGRMHSFFTDRINRLTESVNTLTLNISAPHYGQTDRWILFYRLNGKTWTRADNTAKLNFIELPYGEVRIELQMRDEINQLQSPPLSIVYLISTPWHRTNIGIASVLTFILLSASIIAYLLIRRIDRRKQKRFLAQQRKAELEHKVLRNMLNPHFLNNALNAIQAFVVRNDQRKTLGYLAKFARLMRVNLELLEASSVSLEKELQNLELYLEFEVLRCEGKLTYTIETDPSVNPANLKVPSLIIQPFAENAIWHGILPGQEKGSVCISIRQIEKWLNITIIDDGIGINEATKRKSDTATSKPSRGLMLIQERFNLLNLQKPGHRFTITDNASNGLRGTTVHIMLPVQ